jgi:hypothetical protein
MGDVSSEQQDAGNWQQRQELSRTPGGRFSFFFMAEIVDYSW